MHSGLNKFGYLLLLTTFILNLEAQALHADSTFTFVYSKILAKSCAVATCHDGSFEPDLRTITSAYNTIVYQPANKNNAKHSFKYRVFPGQPEQSVLYQRITNCCFVNENDRMPLTSDTLSRDNIEIIYDWIKNGAEDFKGKIPLAPINLPDIQEKFNAYINDSVPVHGDQSRKGKKADSPILLRKSNGPLTLDFEVQAQNDSNLNFNLILSETTNFDKVLYRSRLQPIKGKMQTQIPLQQFNEGVELFLRLEIDRNGNKLYEFPNLSTARWLFSNWSIYLEKD